MRLRVQFEGLLANPLVQVAVRREGLRAVRQHGIVAGRDDPGLDPIARSVRLTNDTDLDRHRTGHVYDVEAKEEGLRRLGTVLTEPADQFREQAVPMGKHRPERNGLPDAERRDRRAELQRGTTHDIQFACAHVNILATGLTLSSGV